MGRWRPPPDAILKINTDGSSRGNPGQAGVGGIGRDMDGNVIFIFSIHKGVHSNNVMEALPIKLAMGGLVEIWMTMLFSYYLFTKEFIPIM